MGGGDLNMKKSWHPVLIKNQQVVWERQQAALEEKKKFQQLQKEREEERQVQELQRLQEMSTGRKRTEKLEWLYATPAAGNLASANDLEDYLLGKKRVDKILVGDENARLGASHKNFIAVQNANTARDVASKIREDPLFAMMQEQQARLQAIRENPLLLRELQEKTGITLVKEKKEKKDKKSKKSRRRDEDDDEDGHRRHKRRRYDSRSPSRSRSRSPRSGYSRRRSASPPPRDRNDRRNDRERSYRRRGDEDRYERGRSRSRSRTISPARESFRRHDRDSDRKERLQSPARRHRSRSRSPVRNGSKPQPHYNSRRSPSPPRPQPVSSKRPNGNSNKGYDDSERAARLAAMSSNADAISTERSERLAQRLAEEKTILAAEEAERARSAKDGLKGGSFLGDQQRKVMDINLGERMRRGHGGMQSQRE